MDVVFQPPQSLIDYVYEEKVNTLLRQLEFYQNLIPIRHALEVDKNNFNMKIILYAKPSIVIFKFNFLNVANGLKNVTLYNHKLIHAIIFKLFQSFWCREHFSSQKLSCNMDKFTENIYFSPKDVRYEDKKFVQQYMDWKIIGEGEVVMLLKDSPYFWFEQRTDVCECCCWCGCV